MKVGRPKFLLALLTFVTIGLIIGSLLQLIFIHKLEGISGNHHWENDKEASALRLGMVKPEVLSWSPRIILFHNFLSTEECEYLKAISSPRMQESTVVDARTGKGMRSQVRTSTGTFLTPEEAEFHIVQAIEKRIAIFAQVPVENGERIQVLRYGPKQFYKPHHDYFSDKYNIKRGQRVATMLMYLSDDVEGGETIFPMAGSGVCSCGGQMMQGLCVKPKKGDALLFWSLALTGESDKKSLHGGCDVLRGEKWSATKWMREKQVAS